MANEVWTTPGSLCHLNIYSSLHSIWTGVSHCHFVTHWHWQCSIKGVTMVGVNTASINHFLHFLCHRCNFSLFPYTQVEDNKARLVRDALNSLETLIPSSLGPIQLDFFSKNNFIGLFLQDNFYKYFSELVSMFGKECKKHGKSVIVFMM